MPIKIITTEDGSHSLFDEELNETYHSTRGAVGESTYVFIEQGLKCFVDKQQTANVKVLEIGLGTGLNALLSAQFAQQYEMEMHFTSLEPFPLGKEIFENLNYGESDPNREPFLKIHESPWEVETEISNWFSLRKSKAKLEHFETSECYHVIFFDAFAPSKQAEMWSAENLEKCFRLLEPGGILTTYCAQGQFKRNLADVGFRIETLQGAMGKKEMVRAVKE